MRRTFGHRSRRDVREPETLQDFYRYELRARLRPTRVPPPAPIDGKPGTRTGQLIECRFHLLKQPQKLEKVA